MKTVNTTLFRERFNARLQLSLIMAAILVSSIGFAQTQLSHWPLFQSTFAEIEIDFTGPFTVLMPPGYPATTDKNNIPLNKYRAMNTFHDANGNLLFYVVCDDVDTYIYDASGNKLTEMATFSNHVSGVSSSEIGIVPIPNTCLSGFHVLVGGQILVINLTTNEIWWGGSSSSWRYSFGLRLNPAGGGGAPIYDYPMAIGEVRQDGYTVYSIEANAIGVSGRYVTKRDVSFCQSGGIHASLQISSSTFRNITTTSGGLPQSSFHEYASEMEVSPDGSYLAFSDNSHIYVLGIDNTTGNHSSFRKFYTFPNNSIPGSYTYRIGGLEFSSNNKLVFSYFDRTIGSTAGGVGVWDFLNQPTANLISSTSDYGRSQIELGRDNKVYVTGPNALDVVNISSLSVTSTGILAGALTLNEPLINNPGFDNSIRTLPDQIDGYDYVNFMNNPNFPYQGTVYDTLICYGSTIELVPTFGYCYNLLPMYSSINWDFPVTNTGGGHFETAAVYGDATITASFTNEFGCTVEEEFFIHTSHAPVVLAQTIDVCEGDNTSVFVQCGSGSFEWLSPPSMIGSSTSFLIILDATQNEDYVYRCLDENGCEVARYTTHINVIDLPELDATVVPICEGYVVNLDDYLPAGFNCGWVNDLTGLPLTDPHVSPSQGTPYTATCVNSFGCTVYKQVYVDVVQQAVVLPYITMEACEGDFVDHSVFIPSGWVLHEINVGSSSEVFRYASYDASGCLTYHDVTINYLPKTTHNITITASCGELINLDDYNELCAGYGMDWTVAATQVSVNDPLQVISGTVAYTGSAYIMGSWCCEVNLTIEVPEPDVLEADVCMGGLPPFPCLYDGSSEWFKDGAPYSHTFFNGPGQYRVLCKDNYGCVLKEYIFNVPDGELPVCYQEWKCYDDLMGASLMNPCNQGETVSWLKNGNPYPMAPDFSIIPNGVGSYVAYCVNDEGDVVIYRYEIYDCQRFYKTNSNDPNQDEEVQLSASIDAFRVFPNPSEGVINIALDEETAKNSATIFIADNSGRLVKQYTTSTGETALTIDLSAFSKGVYLITYKSQLKTISSRLVLL